VTVQPVTVDEPVLRGRPWSRRRARDRPGSWTRRIAWAVLVIFVLAAVFAPVIAPYDPREIHPADRLLGPGSEGYLLGTDELGRDLFTLLLYGARITLGIALAAELVAVVVGVPLALLAGYRGGAFDAFLMRCVDGMLGIPGFILALMVVGLFGASIPNLIIAIAIMNLPYLIRVVRSAVMIESNRLYVLASRAGGSRAWRVMLSTITPNIMSPLIVQISFGLAVAVLQESALSFLGLGVQPPQETWGSLLQAGYALIRIDPWQAIAPGVCIFAAVWSLNVLGDSLRDAVDPRLRNATGTGR
jgi:peptide/nickel transport system permease protein